MNTARGRPGPRGARFAVSLSAIQTRAINQTISLWQLPIWVILTGEFGLGKLPFLPLNYS